MLAIDPVDVHPLTDFQRDAKAFIARMRKNGRPVLLTINGRAGAILQSPETFGEHGLSVDDLRLLKSINEAIAGKGRPLREVAKKLTGAKPRRRPRAA